MNLNHLFFWVGYPDLRCRAQVFLATLTVSGAGEKKTRAFLPPFVWKRLPLLYLEHGTCVPNAAFLLN